MELTRYILVPTWIVAVVAAAARERIDGRSLRQRWPRRDEAKKSGSALISDLDHYDRLRENLTCDRSDVCEIGGIDQGSGENRSFQLRHLAVFVPLLEGFSFFTGGFDIASGALLAVHHFNNRMDTVVPEIADVAETCDIKFTVELFATEFVPFRWQEFFLDTPIPRTTLTAAGAFTNHILPRRNKLNATMPFPTALIGGLFSETTETLATITGLNDVPLIGFSSEIHTLDNKDQYPLFGRLVPSHSDEAFVVLDYLAKKLQVTHLGVIIELYDQFEPAFVPAFKNAAAALDPPVQLHIETFTNVSLVPNAIRRLKNTQYRYFFGSFKENHFSDFITEAYQQGIVGDDYFWIVKEPEYFDNKNYTAGSPVARASHGMAVLESTFGGGLEGRRGWDAYVASYNATMRTTAGQEYFHSKIPNHIKEEDYYAIMSNLTEMKLGTHAYLIYDAVIAVALSACKAARSDRLFSATDLYQSFLDTKLDGAFGKAKINRQTGSRDYRTIPYEIENVRALPPDEHGNVSFVRTKTHDFELSDDGRSVWLPTSGESFIYSDGSTVPPAVLPSEATFSIGTGAIIAGLVLCGISMGVTLVLTAWTIKNRKTRTVRASQPIFLGMLCVGSLMIGSTIIPLSLQYLGSDKAVCMAIPWLFSLGFTLAFSALFSKTMRVNKIFHTKTHKRIVVTVRDVIAPFGILFLTNVILLSLLTALSPLTYGESLTGEVDSFGRPESYGTCLDILGTEQIVFVVLLFAVNGFAALLAVIQAWDARLIKMEFRESRFIFISVVVTFEAFLVLVPLLAVLNPTGRYVIWTVVVAVVCLGIMLPMFVPKIIFDRKYRKERAEKAAQKKIRNLRSRELERMAREEIGMSSAISSLATSTTTGDDVKGIKIMDLRSNLHRGTSRLVLCCPVIDPNVVDETNEINIIEEPELRVSAGTNSHEIDRGRKLHGRRVSIEANSLDNNQGPTPRENNPVERLLSITL